MTAWQKFRSVAKSTQSTERRPISRRGDHRPGSRCAGPTSQDPRRPARATEN